MKKVASLLFILVVFSTFTFSRPYKQVSGGFGFGFSGSYLQQKLASSAGTLDDDFTGRLLAFNPVDVEGRLIFNNSNIALMANLTFGFGALSIGDLLENYKDDFAYDIGLFAGLGYRINIADTLHIIPSFVFGSNLILFNENETTAKTETTTNIGICAIQTGLDLAAIWQVGKRACLEFSTMATVNVFGNGGLVTNTNSNKDVSVFLITPGKFNFKPRIGFFLMF